MSRNGENDPSPSQGAYQEVLHKLDAFIRRYYKNQVLRGGILFLAISLASLLLVAILEHVGRFNTTVRTFLFYGYLVANGIILVRYVVIPLAKMYRLGQVIDYEQAARIVGKHFPEVRDKLLNTLQLHRQAAGQQDPATRRLILAGIDQKSTELRPVPFSLAIRLGENKRYLKYALAPLVVMLLLLLRAPGTLVESTNRLIGHREYYEVESPFDFRLANDSLRAIRNEDYQLRMRLEGEERPREVYVEYDGRQYRMAPEKGDRQTFAYTFNNLQEDVDFRFWANGFRSRDYELDVLPAPRLRGFTVALDYPEYTGKEDKKLDNVGDLSVPTGTEVRWQLRLEHTRQVQAAFHDTTYRLTARGDELSFSRRFTSPNTYYLLTANEFVRSRDSIRYRVETVPDAYPSIEVTQEQDSAYPQRRYFSGKASDDYAISQVQFVYKLHREGQSGEPETEVKNLPTEGESIQPVFHTFDLNKLELKAGDYVTYFFRTWDNDAINGRKSARSQTFSFRAPTREALERRTREDYDQLKDKMEETADEAQKLQQKMEQTRLRLMEKNNIDWQDRQSVENLMKRQENLQKQVQELQQQYRRSTQRQQQYGEMDPQTMEKHRELQKMMEEMMNPEMKKMMEKLNELLQQNQKDKSRQKLQELKQEDQNLEQNLKRMKELFKQLEMEEMLRKNIRELEDMARKQKDLAQDKLPEENSEPSEEDSAATKREEASPEEQAGEQEKENSDAPEPSETPSADERKAGEKAEEAEKQDDPSPSDKEAGEDSDADKQSGQKGKDQSTPPTQEELEQSQQKLNEEFEAFQQKMEQLQQKNKELNRPHDMEEFEQEQQDIQREMERSLQQMQQGQRQQSRQSQQNASEQMQQLAQKLNQMQRRMQKESIRVDYNALRQLLENLVFISKEQEEVMENFDKVRNYNPRYVELRQQQFKLKEDAAVVEDSLRALAERVMMIKPYVTREMDEVNHFMKRSIEELDERRTGQAQKNQQYVMTHINNLAVMLSEVLDNMQQQLSSMMSGKQMMQMQSQGQGSSGKQRQKQLQQMRQMQQKLNEQMGKLQSEQAKQRAQENKQKAESGQSGTGGEQSEDLARLAAQQEALRQKLRELQKQGDQKGGQSERLQELRKQMDETEEDLLNKNITQETLRRQERVIEQLLQAEEAERQRETSPERKSESAKEYQREEPPSLEEYKARKMKELELLRTLPPALSNYYKQRVMNYFDQMKKQ